MSWKEIPGAEAPLRCWLQLPSAPRSLVLVLPEVFGINSWMRSCASRLVAAGHGALVLSIFARTAPELDLAYDDDALQEGRRHRDAVTVKDFQLDVDVVLGWIANQPSLASLPLAGLGFCFGGHLAWYLACRPELQATVSFYGARVSSFAPGGGQPTLHCASAIPGVFEAWMGADDSLMPPEEQQAIKAALSLADPKGQRLRCSIAQAAAHGFMCDQREDYQPQAAERGWQSLVQLLDGLESR